MPHSHRCFQNHMGLWAIEPTWFTQALDAIRSGVWKPDHRLSVEPRVLARTTEGGQVTDWDVSALPLAQPTGTMGGVPVFVDESPDAAPMTVVRRGAQNIDVVRLSDGSLAPAWASPQLGALVYAQGDFGNDGRTYPLLADGIAVLSIDGPMMKHRSKFGGTSTIALRSQIREALADDEVRGILLHIDSPGGHVAGTYELAAEVANARRKKPTHAYGEDVIASAAFWTGSQAARLSINSMGQAGSLGTVLVVDDHSKAFEEAGVKTHVISTGPFKGAGALGTEILPEHLAYLQELVDSMNAQFMDGVKRGRKLSDAQLRRVSDGRVWLGEAALERRLVDAVEPLDVAVEHLRTAIAAKANRRRPADEASARLRLLEGEAGN